MLNENIVGGKWKLVKGQIRKAWGKITDDELEQTKGNLTQVTGLVQQRYGENQESIRTRINDFITELGDTDVADEFKPQKQ